LFYRNGIASVIKLTDTTIFSRTQDTPGSRVRIFFAVIKAFSYSQLIVYSVTCNAISASDPDKTREVSDLEQNLRKEKQYSRKAEAQITLHRPQIYLFH
jgi:hypothetical protein